MFNKLSEILNLNEHNVIKKNISDIFNSINNILTSVNIIELELNDINDDITSLNNDNTSINNSITAINNSINSLNNSITDIHDGLDALELQVNNIIINGMVTFRIVPYSGIKDGVNTIFNLSSHAEDLTLILNGIELVENVHYNYNLSTNIVTIIDLNSIPLSTDYLIMKGNY